MAIKKEIILKHDTVEPTEESDVYIDINNIDTAKSQVEKDLKNIETIAQNIKKTFKTLENHPSTKGQWKEMASKCSVASTKIQNKMEKATMKLLKRYDKSLTAMVRKYKTTDELTQSTSDITSLGDEDLGVVEEKKSYY